MWYHEFASKVKGRVNMERRIIFLGSSVTYGDDGWSMCDYVNEDERYSTVKWAVSGTTLSDISEESYVSRLKRQIDTVDVCDCFVCQLSTNDASSTRDLPLGALGKTKNIDEFDTSTVVGAIEYIIARALQRWNCPILFYTGTYMENEKYQKMVDALLEVGKKWNIEILDLWNDEEMRAVSKEDYDKYMKDPVHPNRLGYREWWGPEFIKALNRICYKCN